MSEPNVSHEMPIGITRSKPVRGGKATCSAPGCDEPHAPGNGYCRHHHNEHEKARQKRARAELHRLRAAEGMK